MDEMAFKSREEVVGKRFLAVRNAGRLKLNKISEWDWLSGVVRAVSCRDSLSTELLALVEFDDREWKKREWVRVHDTFQVFIVENTLLWAEREDIHKSRPQLVNWPALSFKPLVDKVGISGGKRKPVEFLVDRHRSFVEEGDTAQYQEGDESQYPAANNYPEVKKAIKDWQDYQDGQQILLTTPTILSGYRVEVYRAEGTTQWYTAVIQSYNSTSKTLAVTDDTVLEEHNEDPALVQMRLIDDGVVDSILRGVEVGITPRRRPRNSTKEKPTQPYNSSGHYTRHNPAQSPARSATIPTPTNRSSNLRKNRQRRTSGSSNTDSEKEKVPEVTQVKSKQTKERKRKPTELSPVDSPRPAEISIKKNKVSDKRTSGKTDLQETVKEISKLSKTRRENSPECRSREISVKKQQKEISRKNRTSGEPKGLSVDTSPQAVPHEEPRVPPIISPIPPCDIKNIPEVSESAKTKSQQSVEAASKSIKNVIDNLTVVDKTVKNKVSRSGGSLRNTIVNAEAKTKRARNSPVQSEKSCLLSSVSEKLKRTENVKKVSVTKNVTEVNSGESEEMHFKKLHLLAGESSKEKAPQSSLNSANIDVTRSVTDQVAKLAKSEAQQQGSTCNTNANLSLSSDLDRRPQELIRNPNKSAETVYPGERQTSTDSQGNVLTTMPNAAVSKSIEGQHSSRSGSVLSQERPVSRHSEENTSSSRLDDLRSVKNSPASSPLIIDRNEPVNPYRDPELMRKNPVHSMLGVPKPIGASSYPNVHQPIPGPPGSMPASTLANHHPLSRTLMPMQSYSQLSGLSLSHLQLPRSAQLDPIAAREITSLAQQQQQQHLALQYQNQHLLPLASYQAALPGNLNNTQLELLWQQKYPTVPVPPQWMLAKYQEDLIRGSMLRERELSEERERERRIERDRREREIERDRLEREKAERDRAERERIDRERERVEKERLEREREKQERNRQERDRERHQDHRILKESVEAAAAVNQHFTESLRLAEQKKAATGVWPSPSITLGTGKGSSRSTEAPPAHTQPPPAHSGVCMDLKSAEHKDRMIMEERAKQAAERDHRHSYSPHDRTSYSPQDRASFSPHQPGQRVQFLDKHQELIRQQTEEKRRLALEQDHLLRHQQYIHETQQKALIVDDKYVKPPEAHSGKSTTSTNSGMESKSGHLYAPYPYQYRNSMYVSTASTPSTASHVQSVKQEPNFSLYGYQPFQHSYIPSDKVHLRGLSSAERERGPLVKEERDRHAHGHHAHDHHAQSNSGRSSTPQSASKKTNNMASPPPLIKDHGKGHSSVIVDNRSRDGMKSGSPHSAGQYHSVSPVVSGSSRPPTAPGSLMDRQPDRPASSSSTHSSPSSSTLAHHLQSQPLISSLTSMPSHASAFRAAEKSASSRAQSPLHVASPQMLSAAVIRPMEYPKTMHSHGQLVGSPAPGTVVSNPNNHVGGTVGQPVTSSPHTGYTYSLIQQGLVPNPIYSQSADLNSTKVSDAQPTQIALDHKSSGHSQSSGGSGSSKRKSGKDGSSRKKHKSHMEFGESTGPPTTSHHSLYSPNPHKVTGHYQSSPLTTGTTTVLTASTSSATKSVVSSGYMDCFQSFVETTVHNAFLQDQEKNRNKPKSKGKGAFEGQKGAFEGQKGAFEGQKPGGVSPSSHQQPKPLPPHQTHQTLQQHLQTPHPQANPVQSQPQYSQPQPHQFLPHQSTSPSSNCVTTSQLSPKQPPVSQSHSHNLPQQQPSVPIKTEPSSGMSPEHLMNSNSCSSIMDTINRVANGVVDTDSDTLSAPSPPPLSRNASPHKSGNHTKLKKAWLQRHSDEDKKEVKQEAFEVSPSSSPPSTTMEDSKPEKGTEGNPLKRQKIRRRKRNNGAKKSKLEHPEGGNPSKKKLNLGKTEEKETDIDEHKLKSNDVDGMISQNHESDMQEKKTGEQLQESTKKILQEHLAKISSSSKDPPAERVKSEKIDKTLERVKSEKTDKTLERVKSEKTDKTLERVKSEKTDKTLEEKISERKEKKKKRKNKEIPKEDLDKSRENFNRPLVKATVSVLKKTCEPFLQAGSCSEVTPKLMKCRECKMTPTQLKVEKTHNIFCRFYAFRRLRYSPKGYLTIAGFSELADAESDDIRPWIPKLPVMEPLLDIKTAKYIVAKVGDKFCELVEQEKEARAWAGDEAKVTWKRAVTGVREMCDACDTTLFNIHWVCQKCGFVVCLDCFKARMRKDTDKEAALMDAKHNWLKCSSNRQPHEPEKLMLTQIIPCTALWELGKMIHDIRQKWNILSDCPCGKNKDPTKHSPKNGLIAEHGSENSRLVNGLGEDKASKRSKKSADPYLEGFNTNNAALNGKSPMSSLTSYNPDTASPLNLLADVASMDIENNKKRHGDSDSKQFTPISDELTEEEKKNPAGCSTLRELLTKNAGKMKAAAAAAGENNKKKPKVMTSTLDDIIQSVVEKSLPKDQNESPALKLTNYIPKLRPSFVNNTPIPVQNLTETSVKYPDVPHSWLCDGRLLRLHDPQHRGNFKIFQEQWKRGQPVMVSGIDKLINRRLWKPETFSKEFGPLENDLVNTRSGLVLVGHTMSDFWDGFEYLGKRVKDSKGEPSLLKLKDWPPGDDFSELLPSRFEDLMRVLPLPEYTHRNGRLNLASRLPDFLVKPDLGPKMYNAYGSANHNTEGTTNLHLDVSDAVNCMLYVGIPGDGPGGRVVHEAAALKCIDGAGCDEITKRRVREVNEVPGALWHIFDARDADKMRDFLNKVGKERGEEIEPHHDPIHDQSWYLDEELRTRLYKEYGVEGYTIIQCMGDCVFIPAGAPHQVRNLHSCIKVAEDFVSPEHLNHCFRLTQEFRHLSDTHSNHEDKLQVKNIIYHAVKDALAILHHYDSDDEDN